MVVGFGELARHALIHRARRDDVEHGEPENLRRMVERHAVRDAAAAVVADDEEFLVAERPHDFDLVLRHRPLGVVGVVGQAVRLFAVAVAAQVRGDHAEALGELRGDLVPDGVRLRIAVKQEQRRPDAALDQVDRRAARPDASLLESRKEPVHEREFLALERERARASRYRAERDLVARKALEVERFGERAQRHELVALGLPSCEHRLEDAGELSTLELGVKGIHVARRRGSRASGRARARRRSSR
mgnify:CR=1 FL=1